MKFKLKQIIKMLFQHVIFPLIYNVNRGKRINDGLVVLADAHHSFCPPHMEEIRRALLQKGYNVREYFFDLGEINSWQGIKKMLGFMKDYPTFQTVIICDYFLPVAACNKKNGTTVIQLWHGSGAFKKFGHDTLDDIPKGYKGNVFKNMDIVTVSGDACIPHFKSAMGVNCNIVAEGVSHTDRLYDKEYISGCREKFSYLYPDSRNRRVVLWAPTFRGNAAKAYMEGEELIEALSNDQEIRDEFFVIKSPHPHINKGCDMSTDQLIACADILITDYSSIFYDYLILNGPIVFMAPDYSEFSKTRGFYQEYSQLPGEIIKDDECNLVRLKEILFQVSSDDKKREERQKYKEKYMSACDGNVTERIIEKYFKHINGVL